MAMSKESVEVVIRDLREEDLPSLRELTDKETWNHSEEYLNFCRQVTPGGYKVAVDDSGNIISHCGACKITDDIGFIAFYITQPEVRGKGISKRVFDACMAFLGDINVALNGAIDKHSMYASGAFKISTFKMVGYIGRPNYGALEKSVTPSGMSATIFPVTEKLYNELLRYDDKIHPTPRHELLKRWLARPGMQAVAAMDQGHVVGYACIGRAAKGYRIMPLYAENATIARHLWKSAIDRLERDAQIEVAAVIPENTSEEDCDAVKLFTETINVTKGPFYNVRMFTRENIKPNLTAVYSILNYDTCFV